jgi:hypothetical protein
MPPRCAKGSERPAAADAKSAMKSRRDPRATTDERGAARSQDGGVRWATGTRPGARWVSDVVGGSRAVVWGVGGGVREVGGVSKDVPLKKEGPVSCSDHRGLRHGILYPWAVEAVCFFSLRT